VSVLCCALAAERCTSEIGSKRPRAGNERRSGNESVWFNYALPGAPQLYIRIQTAHPNVYFQAHSSSRDPCTSARHEHMPSDLDCTRHRSPPVSPKVILNLHQHCVVARAG
jgi:hypothetical protein